MLDFDYICQRKTPSVKCIVYPFAGGDALQAVLLVFKTNHDAGVSKLDPGNVVIFYRLARSLVDFWLVA